jgi:ribonuclease G
MTVVDVNTGAFVGRAGHATTVLQTNLEAAGALANELRLRDLGGVIVVDFIDMQGRGDRDRVLAALHAAVADDAMRVHIGGISPLGLVEMTRKRTRRSLAQLLTKPCSRCDGHGTVGVI